MTGVLALLAHGPPWEWLALHDALSLFQSLWSHGKGRFMFCKMRSHSRKWLVQDSDSYRCDPESVSSKLMSPTYHYAFSLAPTWGRFCHSSNHILQYLETFLVRTTSGRGGADT